MDRHPARWRHTLPNYCPGLSRIRSGNVGCAGFSPERRFSGSTVPLTLRYNRLLLGSVCPYEH